MAMAVQGHGAEESSAGESEGMGGIRIIKMLEDGGGGTANITGGTRQAAAGNNVNEGAEMPIAMRTAEHRETTTASTRIIDKAATRMRFAVSELVDCLLRLSRGECWRHWVESQLEKWLTWLGSVLVRPRSLLT